MVLRVECVTKAFNGTRVLTAGSLRGVSGEVRALLGRNGAGKSTLVKIAAGWIQPDNGAVHFDGECRLNTRLHMLAARGLFYLPDHDFLSNAFTVREQLEMIRARFDGGDPDEAAGRMGIAGAIDRRPWQLSGGELRRAELAAVLVRRPLCLLADEPWRGVAPADAELLTATFRDLARTGCAVVVTGHEVHTILAAADHVTWCTAGTTIELGAPAAAVRHERFKTEYLGPSFQP